MKAVAALAAIVVAGLLAASVAFAQDVTPSPTPAVTATQTSQPTVTPTPVPTMPGCFPGVAPSPLAPVAPSDLRIHYLGRVDGHPRLMLKWDDNSADEACFGIEKRVDDGPWQWETPIPANTTTYIFDIDSDEPFCYRVYAGTEAGRSDYSDEACLGPPPPVLHCAPGRSSTPLPDLLPPSNLDAQLITADGIVSGVRLVWQDNSPDETCFGVQRKRGEEDDWRDSWSLMADTTEDTDRLFYAPGLYCYRVYAGNAEGTSAPSDETCIEVSVATMPTPSPDACTFGELLFFEGAEAPTNLQATLVTSIPGAEVIEGYAVALKWEDNADDDCGYRVSRRVGEEPPYKWLSWEERKANVTSYFDVPSSVGRHCYKVVVFSAYGRSDPSNEACLDVEVVPTLVYVSPTPIPSPEPVPTLVLPTGGVAAGGGGHLASSNLPSSVWWAMAGIGVSLLTIAVLAFAGPTRR